MSKTKVLMIQSRIPPYRLPIYMKLAEYVDLTILYEKGDAPENVSFQTEHVKVKSPKHFRKLHTCHMLKRVQKYDVVIMMLDPSYFTTHLLVHDVNHVPVILWGIGVAAARDMRYDGCEKTARILCDLIQRADAALFYSDYPVEKYVNMGVPKEKMFVAHNTVEVLEVVSSDKKDILFVGTLYKEKKIFELLQNYENAYMKNSNIPNLTIVGDGEEFQAIEQWIAGHQLSGKITMTGAVFEEDKLATHFAKAFMCISPDQAGLSVLKSLGYGVPFVTQMDAITGGERFDVIPGETGILFDDFNEIENIILDCATNPEKYIEMGKKAREYYREKRTVEKMVDGFLQAIEYLK